TSSIIVWALTGFKSLGLPVPGTSFSVACGAGPESVISARSWALQAVHSGSKEITRRAINLGALIAALLSQCWATLRADRSPGPLVAGIEARGVPDLRGRERRAGVVRPETRHREERINFRALLRPSHLRGLRPARSFLLRRCS